MKRQSQAGITLVVSLIMLVVLTLLVVSAIRFGNINLKIAANAQFDAEASAASMVALEKALVEIADPTKKVDEVPAQTIAVSTGAVTYTVSIAKPKCVLTKNVYNTELDQHNEDDRPCYESCVSDIPGVPCLTACKDQQWDVSAALNDTSSGAQVEMLQGVAVRVGAEVQCL